MSQVRKVAVIGGARIPFCRSNTDYFNLSNLDMLTRSLQALSDKYKLHDQLIEEVVGGAVVTHSRDWNLAREAVLGTSLSPLTPAVTIQQACGTSLQAALQLGAKIAAGHIDSGIACGTDTTSDAPIVLSKRFNKRLLKLNVAKTGKQRLKAFKGFRFKELVPDAPGNGEPRTRKSMGQHCEMMAQEWGIARADQDALALESHQKAAAAFDAGFFDDLVFACEGVTRDNNMRPDISLEKLASLRNAFDKSDKGTLTAGNSTTLTDGSASVLLASEEWAEQHGLPVQAYLTFGRNAAVDFVGKNEGLLMAPTVAVSEMLTQAKLGLQDFDFYEIHEAFAAQVLCTLAAWESEDYCKNRLGRSAALGAIDRTKMNVKGSSLAAGHPFAATGARIIGTLGKILEEAGSGRGLISVCTAGGMGVSAILERP